MALLSVNLPEMKVLVVDDSGTARRIVRELLDSIGVVQVAMAEDGADAIAKLRTFPADVVLCDLHMAPLDGIEFTRLLRSAEDSPSPFVPVLVLTADATQAQLKNALNAGANDFMSKPVKLEALRRKLIGLFTRPMIFVRDGRYVKPLRTGSDADSSPKAAGDRGKAPEEPQPARKGAPVDYSEPGVKPLTHADMGVR